MLVQQLIQTIQEDCKLWEQTHNAGQMMDSYLYLQVCNDSETTGMYQLILNGHELWYGTLAEINAIVKSMVIREENNDFLYMEN